MGEQRPLSAALPLPLPRALAIGAALCDAVVERHRGGEALGALHPDDVLLGDDAAVAKLRPAEAPPETPGARPGDWRERAAPYLAPEVAREDARTAAGDVYSLGALLFHLLTGRPPFQAATAAALRVKHAIEPPPDARALQPALPVEVAEALRAALAKDPARRPAPAALAAALRAATGPAAELIRAAAQPAQLAPAPPRAPAPLAPPGPLPPAAPPPLGAPVMAPPGSTAPPAAMAAPGRRSSDSAFSATPGAAPVAARPRWLLPAGGALLLLAVLGAGLSLRRTAAPRAGAPAPVSSAPTSQPAPAPAPPTPPALEEAKSAPGRGSRPAPVPRSPTLAPTSDSRRREKGDAAPAKSAKKSSKPAPKKLRVRSLDADGEIPSAPTDRAAAPSPGRASAPAPASSGAIGRGVPAPDPGGADQPLPAAGGADRPVRPVDPPAPAGGEQVVAPPEPEPSSAGRLALLALLALLGVAGVAAVVLPLLPRRRPGAAPPPDPGPLDPRATVGVFAQTVAGLPPAPTSEVETFSPFVVGRYRCVARLGEGGMGMVYKAEHVDIGRLSAVKVMLPQAALSRDAAARFRREARLAASINHPNSVFIYDYDEADGGLLYLAMEFIEGRSLADVLDPDDAPPQTLPLGRVLPIVRQVSGALEAAHGLGIVHRDLKPQNVMLCQRPGQGELVKVVDFGIARALEPDQRMTMVGAVLGTPDYMSPEQARGAGDVDARSDVFSLGLLTCRMLSGSIPFAGTGRTPIEQIVARAMLREPPPPLRQLRPDLSPALEAALLRALEPDPQRRTPTARQLAEELEAAARS